MYVNIRNLHQPPQRKKVTPSPPHKQSSTFSSRQKISPYLSPSFHLMKTRLRTHINLVIYMETHFKQLAAQCLLQFTPSPISTMNHTYSSSGQRLDIDKLLHLHPKRWQPSLSNELGRMTKQIRSIEGNNVLQFIPKTEVPHKSHIWQLCL